MFYNNETPPSPGGRNSSTAGIAGGSSFQVPQGNPPTFGTCATLMLFQSVPTPKTTTVSPRRNFLNILSKDQKSLWCKMVKPSDNRVLLHINVSNSKAIVNLFQDQAISFCWMSFMRIPTSGTGAMATNSTHSPGNKEIYSADLKDFKNLIEAFQHISLKTGYGVRLLNYGR